MMHEYLDIAPSVAASIADGRPVVALESTIVAHGMPYPENLETARRIEQIIRDDGAEPATIAIFDGRLKVGLIPAELERLASDSSIGKASVRDIPYLIATKLSRATTVSATMRIAALAGITIFATGGIGGVHRGGAQSFDISTDLTELATTNVAVVSAGAKAILDLELTLEMLETMGVPVVGVGTDEFPAFYSRSSGLKVPMRLDKPASIAVMMRSKWQLGLQGGMLIANPIPMADEIPARAILPVIENALQEADQRHIIGKDVTPFLLARIADITGGRSLKANIALAESNARLAAAIAKAYAAIGKIFVNPHPNSLPQGRG